MPQFTTEDLILYLYQETTPEQTKAIERALEVDWKLKEKFDALQESRQQLDSIITSPREQSVMAILNYAKSTAPIGHR